jgi:dUTPase
MQFIKTRDVKDPIRNPFENAGIDFYIPAYCYQFRFDLIAKNPGIAAPVSKVAEFWAKLCKKTYITTGGKICIAPRKDIIIPSGIRSKFGPELALIANNKSGIATKKKLVFGASVIDTSYQGEWHLHLINTSNKYQELECDQKVVQFIPHVISTDPVEILDISPADFYTEKTSRGEGWQGSTGLK